jgi:hypothetical protein
MPLQTKTTVHRWRLVHLVVFALPLLFFAANLYYRVAGHSSIYEYRIYGWPFGWLGVQHPYLSGDPVQMSVHPWGLGGELVSLAIIAAGAYGLLRFSRDTK